MSRVLSQVGRAVGATVAVVVLTWLFFAPVAAFHHIIACGILGPVVLNGETPQGTHLLWGEYEVRFFPGRFALSLILWAFSLFLLFRLIRRKQYGR